MCREILKDVQRAGAQPRKVEMKTLVSRFRVACHQRSGKYSTWRTNMQKHTISAVFTIQSFKCNSQRSEVLV